MPVSGYFFVTVPALPCLWSDDDVNAGHFRRNTRSKIRALLVSAGFQIRFCSYFFTYLVPAVYRLRTIPSRLHILQQMAKRSPQQDHLPTNLPISLTVGACSAIAFGIISRTVGLPFLGASFIAVAQKTKEIGNS